MNGIVIGLLAETFVQVGVGQSDDGVDLPVARERATHYPLIPDSGIKGATRQKYETIDRAEAKTLFGQTDDSGSVSLSEGRLLLLPVRSMTGTYRWVTCPHLLERYQRDRKRILRTDREIDRGQFTACQPGTALVQTAQQRLFLEEHVFAGQAAPALVERVAELVSPLIDDDDASSRLAKQLAVISDDEMVWFCDRGLDVRPRNQLDERKRSRNLWYEEALPPDTLLYSTAVPIRGDGLEKLKKMYRDDPYLRVGGNETLGHGWCRVVATSG